MAVKQVGCSGAKVDGFLGVTSSGVNRLAASEGSLDLDKYI